MEINNSYRVYDKRHAVTCLTTGINPGTPIWDLQYGIIFAVLKLVMLFSTFVRFHYGRPM